MEEWVDVPGYPMLINRLGKIWQPRGDKIDGYFHAETGYLWVNTKKNGKKTVVPIHTLLMLAFKGPKPFPKAEVRHLDGNKLNNDLDNLEWGTRSQNIEDYKRVNGGLAMRAKLTDDEVREIFARSKESLNALALEYGVSPVTIKAIRYRKDYRRNAKFG